MCCSLSGETPANCPLYSACRYNNRLSAQVFLAIHQPNIRMCSTLSGKTTTDSPLCFACRYSNRLFAAVLCLSILQLTNRSTDCPLFSLWRYFNRLYTLTTIRSILSGVTLTDYDVYTTLSIQRYYNQLSALCLAC
jgi:hypothetical protein